MAALLLPGFSCKQKHLPGLNPAQLSVVGRFHKQDHQLELIGSGSHFSFSFEGREASLFTELANFKRTGYLQFELDGKYKQRVRIENNAPPLVIKSATGGKHVVSVYKCTEAHSGPLYITDIIGEGVKSVAGANKPLIEFIGNSITCGAAADPQEVACGQGEYEDQHNAYYAYGPRVARALNTEFILNCVSGYGVYRTWNKPHPSLPEVYNKLDFEKDGNRTWNPGSITPSIVSIALGTNDLNAGDGESAREPFDEKLFVARYVLFVKQIKKWHPTARILLLSSPMLKGNNAAILLRCLQTVKQLTDDEDPSGFPLTIFDFPSMENHGCNGHPSVQDHELMAQYLIPVFKKLMDL